MEIQSFRFRFKKFEALSAITQGPELFKWDKHRERRSRVSGINTRGENIYSGKIKSDILETVKCWGFFTTEGLIDVDKRRLPHK